MLTQSKRFRYWLLIVPLLLVLVIVLMGFAPMFALSKSSKTNPATGFAQAVQRAESFQAEKAASINPVCRTQLMTHAQKTANVIVFVHGNTSCPHQFDELGRQFFDLGYNVLIGRLPHHGLMDRLTTELAQLKAEELIDYVDEMVDIAQGLGDHVTMVGISAGGVIVSWAAQNRADIDSAVVISPAFGFGAVPTVLTRPAMNVALILPNSFVWWDNVLQEKADPAHVYPRYSTHALAQYLRLGFATQDMAGRIRPAAKSILVITNANDTSVNNALTAEITEAWRAHGASVSTYVFEPELGLQHDFIDPALPAQRVDVVYPRLINLINQ